MPVLFCSWRGRRLAASILNNFNMALRSRKRAKSLCYFKGKQFNLISYGSTRDLKCLTSFFSQFPLLVHRMICFQWILEQIGLKCFLHFLLSSDTHLVFSEATRVICLVLKSFRFKQFTTDIPIEAITKVSNKYSNY